MVSSSGAPLRAKWGVRHRSRRSSEQLLQFYAELDKHSGFKGSTAVLPYWVFVWPAQSFTHTHTQACKRQKPIASLLCVQTLLLKRHTCCNCPPSLSLPRPSCLSDMLSAVDSTGCAVWETASLSDVRLNVHSAVFPAGPRGGTRGFSFHCLCWHCADLVWEAEDCFKGDCRHPTGWSSVSPVSLNLPSPPHTVSTYPENHICLFACVWSAASVCPRSAPNTVARMTTFVSITELRGCLSGSSADHTNPVGRGGPQHMLLV